MDALTFGTPRLVRHLMASTKNEEVSEFELSKALEVCLVNSPTRLSSSLMISFCLQGLGMSMDRFIDLCIMCGCDYANNIRGIGPMRSLQLIQKHGSIEVKSV